MRQGHQHKGTECKDSEAQVHAYVRSLQTFFEPRADPTQAAPMAKYMRNQFAFLGLKTPARKRLLKAFIAEEGLPAASELTTVLTDLWHCNARECQYVALDILDRFQAQLTPEIVPTLQTLIIEKSWWDTIDPLASHAVSELFLAYPDDMKPYIDSWRSHENIWLRRVTLLFQLHYKRKTDEVLLFSLVRENLGSQEFFINKAIGWALREYSKVAREQVEHFVQQTPALSPLSRREALKWLKKSAR